MRTLMAQGDPSHYTLPGIDQLAPDLKRIIDEALFGQIWTRPGIDRRTRSFMTLAMLAALNRPHEIAVHVRGTLNNGLSRDEIKEIFLHVLPYCGAPAAIDGTAIAKQVFAEIVSES